MSSSTVALTTDVNTAPAPQYFDVAADAYEAWTGDNGAGHVTLLDASGNPITVTDNRLQTDGNLQVANSDVSATNRVPITSRAGSAIDANNTSTATLAGSAAFTGTWTDLSGAYQGVAVTVRADVDGAFEGLQVQFSPDGTNADVSIPFTVLGGTTFHQNFNAPAQFFRVVYTNGSSAQSAFRLEAVLLPSPGFPALLNSRRAVVTGSKQITLRLTSSSPAPANSDITDSGGNAIVAGDLAIRDTNLHYFFTPMDGFEKCFIHAKPTTAFDQNLNIQTFLSPNVGANFVTNVMATSITSGNATRLSIGNGAAGFTTIDEATPASDFTHFDVPAFGAGAPYIAFRASASTTPAAGELELWITRS